MFGDDWGALKGSDVSDHHHGFALGLLSGLIASVTWLAAHIAQVNGFLQAGALILSMLVSYAGWRKLRSK